GWRVCIVKPSSAGNYSYKFTNAKTGAVVREDTLKGTWGYFTLPASEAKDGLIFESKSTTASHILFADIGWVTPDKVSPFTLNKKEIPCYLILTGELILPSFLKCSAPLALR